MFSHYAGLSHDRLGRMGNLRTVSRAYFVQISHSGIRISRRCLAGCFCGRSYGTYPQLSQYGSTVSNESACFFRHAGGHAAGGAKVGRRFWNAARLLDSIDLFDRLEGYYILDLGELCGCTAISLDSGKCNEDDRQICARYAGSYENTARVRQTGT
ncbi:hypothetical protein D3C77_548180 [compost metagenome]